MIDFSKYLPKSEYQNNFSYDRLSCVTYSILNCLEIFLKYKYGIERNFSDRYIAQLSGTTRQGNTLEAVFQTIKEFGLIEEELYPDDALTWEEYYKTVPQNLINEGQEFLIEYNIDRKWINPDRADLIVKALADTPLQVTVLYATGEGILNPSSNPPDIRNHAVVLYGYLLGEYWLIYDSYSQIIKKYAWNYKFGTILKPLLSKKTMSNVKLVKDTNSSAVGFFVPAVNPEALISMGLNFDKPIPVTPAGEVDWATVNIEGSVTLN